MSTEKYSEEMFILSHNFADVGAAVALTTATDMLVIPCKCRIAEVWAASINVDAGAAAKLDVYTAAGASIFATYFTLAADATVYGNTPSAPATEYAKGAKMTVRYYTAGSTGAIVRPQVTLVCYRVP